MVRSWCGRDCVGIAGRGSRVETSNSVLLFRIVVNQPTIRFLGDCELLLR